MIYSNRICNIYRTTHYQYLLYIISLEQSVLEILYFMNLFYKIVLKLKVYFLIIISN